MRDYFKVSMMIIGSIIGAGFASGKEIVNFFCVFGYAAIPLCVLAGVLLFIMILSLLSLGAKFKPKSMEQVTEKVFGKGAIAVDTFIMLNYVLVLASMFGGADTLMSGYTSLPIGSIATLALAFLTVMLGLKGVKQMNTLLIPILIALITGVCAMSIATVSGAATMEYNYNAALQVVNVILYVGMNILLAAGIVVCNDIPKKEQIKASLLSSIVITAILLLVVIASLRGGDIYLTSPMPILTMSTGFSMEIVAVIIIYIAILTTVISSAYVICTWFAGIVKSKILSAIIVLGASFALSRIGFVTIVSKIYPVSGLIGVFVCCYILIYQLITTVKQAGKKVKSIGKVKRKYNAPLGGLKSAKR